MNFYQDDKTDFKYPEIGICMEYTEGPNVKIAIPIATPTLPLNEPYDNKNLAISMGNIISDKTAISVFPYIESNYITMKLPSEITSLSKGDKVVIMFIGGDINTPFILRRYEE